MESVPSFGLLLKRYRAAKRLSQMELAELSGLSRNGIADLERGARTFPRPETVGLLSVALGLTASQRAHLTASARRPSKEAASPGIPFPSAGDPWPLVGREGERRLLDQVFVGGASVVSVSGPPGIGKSRLLDEASQRASEEGWTVLFGGCHRWSSREVFDPFAGMIAQLLNAAGSAAERFRADYPALAPLVSPGTALPDFPLSEGQLGFERRQLYRAAGQLFSSVAGPAGTLLVLDDVQWIGTDAVQLLESLMGQPGLRPLKVIAAHRSTDVLPDHDWLVFLSDREREGALQRLPLGPLSREDSRVLLKGLPSSAMDASLLERSQGVPYFIVQFALFDPAQTGTVPAGVSECLLQQYELLGTAAQDLVGLVTVGGLEVASEDLLGALAGLGHPESVFVTAVKEALRRNLVKETSLGGLSVSHDLAREVISARIGPVGAKVFHKALGLARETSAGRIAPEVLALHFTQAGLSSKAVVHLMRAGRKALGLVAFEKARTFFQDALALGVEPPPGLREDLARVLMLLGKNQEADELLSAYLDALKAEGEWNQQAGLYADRLDCLIRLGRPEDAVQATAGFSLVAPSLTPSRGLVLYFVNLAFVHYMLKDFASQKAVVKQAEAAFSSISDPFSHWELLEAKALVLATEGAFEEAATLRETQILPLSETLGDQYAVLKGSLNLAATFQMLGEYEREGLLLEKALVLADRMQDARSGGFAAMLNANRLYEIGAWNELESFTSAFLARLTPGDTENFAREVALERNRGRRVRGAQDSTPVNTESSELAGSYQLMLATLEGELRLLSGDAAGALECLAPLMLPPWNDHSGMDDWDALLACALCLAGRTEEGIAMADLAVARAAEAKVLPSWSDTLRYRGWAAQARGDRDAAKRDLDQAWTLETQLGRPYNQAKILGLLALTAEDGPTRQAFWERSEALLVGLGEAHCLPLIQRDRLSESSGRY